MKTTMAAGCNGEIGRTVRRTSFLRSVGATALLAALGGQLPSGSTSWLLVSTWNASPLTARSLARRRAAAVEVRTPARPSRPKPNTQTLTVGPFQIGKVFLATTSKQVLSMAKKQIPFMNYQESSAILDRLLWLNKTQGEPLEASKTLDDVIAVQEKSMKLMSRDGLDMIVFS
ncbi:unnamed protein product, partial [Polarella glacialis]